MTNLNDIISTFSSEDQHRFVAYLSKKNKRSDAKNIQLFNYLLNDEFDSNKICHKLYGSLKKDAYHALRKRLYQSIIDFIANSSLQEENSIDMQIIKYLLASKSFLQHKQYKVAYKILDKAEALASEHYLFPLLNEIYHTKIQYADTIPSISINELVKKFEANQKKHQLEDQLNIVYAKIKQTLNNIAYKGDVVDFQTILDQTLQEHNISISESMSFKSLYQLATIVSISAFVTKDYLQIEPFLINTYNIIIAHKDKEKQHFYHIQIIYLIANALFRNKKFNDSFYYLELMHEHMLIKQKKHYNTYKLKYYLLLALNYNYSNKQNMAIEVLEPLITGKHPDTESLLDIHLSLITFYFQKNEFKKAHTLFSKFYHTDHWYTEKAGKEWVIKKNLIEILLHIELKNIDLVESRLLSFKRNYYNYLKSINQERVITYMGFVESYYKAPETVTSNEFKNAVETSFDWISTHKEDIFVISFYSWLKCKMNNQDLYTTTLGLIKQAQQELIRA
ncbi:hypothetical protein [Flavivirga eckloniae]|uniref:Uncharacterized protein n=1 Tax=Flavivirga eckloniae TaxID=1803846 RepID=A0A2K9PNJ1_9FLAO|nr:hypothetical protein [Flavivirga eckloniae]AUP78640.1 hypothetical protein C1H87_07925 [Flavivirga eckloniae]